MAGPYRVILCEAASPAVNDALVEQRWQALADRVVPNIRRWGKAAGRLEAVIARRHDRALAT